MRRRHLTFQFSVFTFQFVCAKRTILLRQNFVMPRLCYGSAEQVNLLCSHLNRKVQFSPFSFQFNISLFRLIYYKITEDYWHNTRTRDCLAIMRRWSPLW